MGCVEQAICFPSFRQLGQDTDRKTDCLVGTSIFWILLPKFVVPFSRTVANPFGVSFA